MHSLSWRSWVLCFFVFLPSLAAAATDQPTVIVITIDTVRADRMGFLGSKRGLTPHLNALALQSVVFKRAIHRLHLPLFHMPPFSPEPTRGFMVYAILAAAYLISLLICQSCFVRAVTAPGPLSAPLFLILQTVSLRVSNAGLIPTTRAFTVANVVKADSVPCRGAERKRQPGRSAG